VDQGDRRLEGITKGRAIEATAWVAAIFLFGAFLAGVLYGFCDEIVPAGIDQSVCDAWEAGGIEPPFVLPPLLMLVLALTLPRRAHVRIAGATIVCLLGLMLVVAASLN
jgi:hypothetical protein